MHPAVTVALDLAPNLASYSRAAHLLSLTGDVRKALWLMQKAIDAGGPYPENAAWCRAELARMLLQNGAVLPAAQQAEQALDVKVIWTRPSGDLAIQSIAKAFCSHCNRSFSSF